MEAPQHTTLLPASLAMHIYLLLRKAQIRFTKVPHLILYDHEANLCSAKKENITMPRRTQQVAANDVEPCL